MFKAAVDWLNTRNGGCHYKVSVETPVKHWQRKCFINYSYKKMEPEKPSFYQAYIQLMHLPSVCQPFDQLCFFQILGRLSLIYIERCLLKKNYSPIEAEKMTVESNMWWSQWIDVWMNGLTVIECGSGCLNHGFSAQQSSSERLGPSLKPLLMHFKVSALLCVSTVISAFVTLLRIG